MPIIKPIRARVQDGIAISPAPARRSIVERLLEAQRVAVIVIVIVVPAEKSVTRLFIARNRPRVVLVHFEAHCPPSAPPRRFFGRRQKQRPKAAFSKVRSDCDGIKARERRMRWIKYERVAGELAAVVHDD